jgi:hypothetical protein
MKTFISSMNSKLYAAYGKRFIQGWSKHSANDVFLIICFEGELPNDLSIDLTNNCYRNIKIIYLESDLSKRYIEKFGRFHQARGIIFNQDNSKNITAYYNYRFDAIRFSFKIFSIHKCLELNLLNNDFAWIDSDIVCLKDFNSSDLDIFFPNNDQLASYLGRDSFPSPNPYSECGFVAYNFSHTHWRNFVQNMLDIYISGDLFMLPEWHDCMVFDFCRNIFVEKQKIKFKNLSEHLLNCDHPFHQVGLSEFFDHLKGPVRKERGYS